MFYVNFEASCQTQPPRTREGNLIMRLKQNPPALCVDFDTDFCVMYAAPLLWGPQSSIVHPVGDGNFSHSARQTGP